MGIAGVIAGAATVVGSWGFGVYISRRTKLSELIKRTESWIHWTREEGELDRLSATVDGRRLLVDNVTDVLSDPVRVFLIKIERDITERTDEHMKLTLHGAAKSADRIVAVLEQFIRAAELIEAARDELGTRPHEADLLKEWTVSDAHEHLSLDHSARATARYLGRGRWKTVVEAEPSVTLPAFQVHKDAPLAEHRRGLV